MDSVYFDAGSGRQYRLVITGADWLDKENQWLTGLEVGRTYTADELPGDMSSLILTRSPGEIDEVYADDLRPFGSYGLFIMGRSSRTEKGCTSGYTHLSGYYRNSAGEEERFDHVGWQPDVAGGTELYWGDYPGDTIDLEMQQTRHTQLPEPMIIEIPLSNG